MSRDDQLREATQDYLAKAYEMQRTDAAIAVLRERDYWERRALQAENALLSRPEGTGEAVRHDCEAWHNEGIGCTHCHEVLYPPAPAVTEACDWHQDSDGSYRTDCGNVFEFNDGGPWLNGVKFCGYCGNKLVEIQYEEWRDDDEDDDAALAAQGGK